MQQRLIDRGVQVLELDNLKPAQVMAHLYNRGCLSVLWECGGTLAASALADGAIQKVLAFLQVQVTLLTVIVMALQVAIQVRATV